MNEAINNKSAISSGNILVGNVLKLDRRTDKLLPHLGSKFNNGDEVADAESEAHIAPLF